MRTCHLNRVGRGCVRLHTQTNANDTVRFVFYNWTWEPNTRYHYTAFGSHYSPARIPITAYVEGRFSSSPESIRLTLRYRTYSRRDLPRPT